MLYESQKINGMDRTKQAVEIFNRRAGDYQDKFMDFDLYNDTFDAFCEMLPGRTANVLDIACGPGNITKYLLKKRFDLKILGIDLSENMIRLAGINNPTAEFKLMDCRDIGLLYEKYEGIMCGFCLPYLSKEESVKLISDAAKLLNKEGVIYISIMEGDYKNSGLQKSSDGKDEMYRYFHQEDYLTQALKESGFKTIHIERKDFPTQDGTKPSDLIIIGKK